MTHLPSILACCALLSIACGGAPDGAKRSAPLPPLTDAQAQLFDDGVDMIEDPTLLEGAWHEDWVRETDQRLSDADMVALGTVRTVRTDVDPSQQISYRLLFEVERSFKGDARGELSLASHEGTAGHPSLARYAESMLDRKFVVFVKRAGGPGGNAAHFHLTPPSAALDRRVLDYQAASQPNTIKVITHQN